MDLIYTDSDRVDQGVFGAYTFDLSFGKEENDFELLLGAGEPALDFGAVLYIEGTEYGGMVDGRKTSTGGESVTYRGRTWHGIINSKVIEPDAGSSHLSVSGDANTVLAQLVERLGLDDLFTVSNAVSGIDINAYQFSRYVKGYDGIRAMLDDHGAKLLISWENRNVVLSAAPIVDYSATPVDGDSNATLTVERYAQKVNHLICLGSGELVDRDVIHLYADNEGNISTEQYYFGLEEVTEVYDYSNATRPELLTAGTKRLQELRNVDKADVSVIEGRERSYDIGDIIGAEESRSGMAVAAAVTQKIVRINNGAVSIEHQTGG